MTFLAGYIVGSIVTGIVAVGFGVLAFSRRDGAKDDAD